MNRREVIEFGTEVLLTEARTGMIKNIHGIVEIFHPELAGDREGLKRQGRLYAKQLGSIVGKAKDSFGQARLLGCEEDYANTILENQ